MYHISARSAHEESWLEGSAEVNEVSPLFENVAWCTVEGVRCLVYRESCIASGCVVYMIILYMIIYDSMYDNI